MNNARGIFIWTPVHLTLGPSVVKSYPAHLKPPIQAIQGFGGSTILVTGTGYGYIDGPGGKLKHVLLLSGSMFGLWEISDYLFSEGIKD